MIRLEGVSHVSGESIERVERSFEESEPGIVALELDRRRLEALLSGRDSGDLGVFGRLIQLFQRSIGSETGVMPGEEMLHAYRLANDRGIPTALIDRDIGDTLARIGDLPRKEKVRAAAGLLAGVAGASRFEYDSIPSEKVLDGMLEELEKEYPGLYSALVTERDLHMAEALEELDRRTEGDVLAVVGAAHAPGIRRNMDNM